MSPVVEIGAGRVFYDGTTTEPRLAHPEGVAVHPTDGSVWCGGERGEVYRIAPDGSAIELVANTGGFTLGLAFDGDDALLWCDLAHAVVYRMDLATRRTTVFADGVDGHRLKIPNMLAFDDAGRVYVSDSHEPGRPGPGILRLDRNGDGELWYGDDLVFANGICLAPDGSALYVAETFAGRVSRIPIEPDGSAGAREDVALVPGVLADGVLFGPDGLLYIGCYEPSQILRQRPDGAIEALFRDPEAHLVAHPTNLAFRGSTLFTSNLGRWHVTAIETGLDVPAELVLPGPAAFQRGRPDRGSVR